MLIQIITNNGNVDASSLAPGDPCRIPHMEDILGPPCGGTRGQGDDFKATKSSIFQVFRFYGQP